MSAVTDAKSIREAAIDVFRRDAKGQTVDELLCHPELAMSLCRRVRAILGKRTPDPDILRTLLNARKQKLIK